MGLATCFLILGVDRLESGTIVWFVAAVDES